MSDAGLASAVSASLGLGYRFLPHDSVVSAGTIFEKIYFMDDSTLILNRIASRNGSDWFHLVNLDWQHSPFSVSRVDNIYQGQMDFVDQRSWGPYVDLRVRKVRNNLAGSQYQVEVHLYPKFWSKDLEKDVPVPADVKKQAKHLCEAFGLYAH